MHRDEHVDDLCVRAAYLSASVSVGDEQADRDSSEGLGIRGDLPLAWLALAMMMLGHHAYGKQGRDIEDP
jgi:hypothetical protein